MTSPRLLECKWALNGPVILWWGCGAVDGSDFEGADMTLANVEMAQFNRANLKDAVVREMYVSGATLFEGLKSIENTDWTDTMLRRDQQKYLCAHPTAKGTNPTTGVDTRESLMCLD
mmetsp:Transcript_4026/g.6108  ORF Transcript_4026/g.6108 Transcript_4026/m.6108 type:complete len:117 (+) Transcript_4026:1013-1363(+)